MEHEIKANLVEAYDRFAQDRDKSEMALWKIQERDVFLGLLKKERRGTLLEIGAGTGKDSKFFKDGGFEVVATDVSFEMVRLCREKGLSVLMMDFYDMGFLEGSFEAIWALNCLLHVPKRELPDVLKGIRAVLKPKGLFYMGVYGGPESEGIWEDDTYTPKRFFSFYPDERIQKIVSDFFEIFYFKAIPLEEGRPHFQSMILRKNN